MLLVFCACPFQAPAHRRSASPCRNSGEIFTLTIGAAKPTADQETVRVFVGVYLEHVTVQLRRSVGLIRIPSSLPVAAHPWELHCDGSHVITQVVCRRPYQNSGTVTSFPDIEPAGSPGSDRRICQVAMLYGGYFCHLWVMWLKRRSFARLG
jgi:hypothetical protein